MHHQYHHLTPNMKRALARLGEGLKYTDGRSSDALCRRGLARCEAGWRGGHYAAAYYLTDPGAEMLAEQKARQQVRRWILTEKKHLDQAVIDTVMEYAAWTASR